MFLLLFVVLANITMMGVLGGLLVQTVKTVAEVEKEESIVKSSAQTLEDLWAITIEHDDDHDGFISKSEFMKLLDDDRTDKVLKKIDVNLPGLLNVVGFYCEQHDGKLSKTQFKRMILDLRGKNAAKVKDHVETRKFLLSQIKEQLGQLGRHSRKCHKAQ